EYLAALYANQKQQVLESHLLDFSGDLYGKQITVIVYKKLAEAKKFESTQDEHSFIEQAVTAVRAYFNE
ncbi:MAG TPA: riboflavin kinase, partial [Patescibacteria group bacterium]|nr:riboflavin kinase [Patescibacteria group bacterium]